MLICVQSCCQVTTPSHSCVWPGHKKGNNSKMFVSTNQYRITSVKAPWGNIRNQFWGVRKHPVSDNIPVGHYSKRPVGYYPKRWVYMWGERLDVFYWASLPLLTVRECHELEMDISFAFSYILIFNLARNMFLLKKFSISNHLHQKTKHYF